MFEICIHLCIYIVLKRRFGLKSKDLIITSESNGQIKELIKLQKQARERRKTKKFVAEGIKMVLEAINFDKLDKLYVSESAFDRTAQRLGDKLERIPYEVVADNVFKPIRLHLREFLLQSICLSTMLKKFCRMREKRGYFWMI